MLDLGSRSSSAAADDGRCSTGLPFHGVEPSFLYCAAIPGVMERRSAQCGTGWNLGGLYGSGFVLHGEIVKKVADSL